MQIFVVRNLRWKVRKIEVNQDELARCYVCNNYINPISYHTKNWNLSPHNEPDPYIWKYMDSPLYRLPISKQEVAQLTNSSIGSPLTKPKTSTRRSAVRPNIIVQRIVFVAISMFRESQILGNTAFSAVSFNFTKAVVQLHSFDPLLVFSFLVLKGQAKLFLLFTYFFF